ncbi:hypothetical protein BC939DRAFT_481362 [Gamsiella multidivaricata]|uniref:uncharacterized protein n=1 Tax=Gamsiella multidivaricata TaxID=101098 RepID=UPI00221EA834|nr:uncharacterized protein BC939DRAFT_481362 [Gamsiella multidivaricata]KAI7817227.1 hypothetical protein BC939DRAFT_481362 [Gamsiella multidivaricata]
MALLIHHDAVHAATPYYGPAPTPDYGGTAPGAHRPSHFLGSRTVRDTWIALWVMWLLWALLLHLLGPPLAVEAEGAERVVTASSQVVPEDGPYDITRDGGGGLPGESVPVASPALRPAPRPKNFFGRAVDNIVWRRGSLFSSQAGPM